jgi:hypothetical protein
MRKQQQNYPWVFWFTIRLEKPLGYNWKTRGSNFYEIRWWWFRLSIGRPWITPQTESYLKSANEANLKAKYSFFMNRKSAKPIHFIGKYI